MKSNAQATRDAAKDAGINGQQVLAFCMSMLRHYIRKQITKKQMVQPFYEARALRYIILIIVKDLFGRTENFTELLLFHIQRWPENQKSRAYDFFLDPHEEEHE